MKLGICYEFSFYLARLFYYVSISCIIEQCINFNQLVKFWIYGGFSNNCDWFVFFDEIGLVKVLQWMQYNFKFEFKQAYLYILIEAFYEMFILFFYNGNVLVDNVLVIIFIFCVEDILEVFQELLEVEQFFEEVLIMELIVSNIFFNILEVDLEFVFEFDFKL